MAVIRRGGFPRRQEDPLIQQLLERARQEYAQSSAIGSPSMYKAAAGGGFGPVATVLAAQILGGVRSGTAQRQAREIADRQQKSLSTAADLSNLGYTDTSQGRVFVDNEGRLMRVGDIPGQENNIGDLTVDVLKNAKYKINENQMKQVNNFIEESQNPLNEIARIANQEQSPEIIGQEDDISIIEPETTQSSVDPNIPKIPPIGLEPTTVIEGEKPSMLSRVLTGAGDTTKTYRTLGDYITDAGYDLLEYDLFQDQLKQKTAPKYDKINTFYIWDENNQKINVTRFLLNNLTGEIITDTKGYSFKEPTTYTYGKPTTNANVVYTQNGQPVSETDVLVQVEYAPDGKMTGYGYYKGERVKIKPIEKEKVTQVKPSDFELANFEKSERQDFQKAKIYTAFKDINMQSKKISEVNNLRNMQDMNPEKYKKEALKLIEGEENKKNFLKAIEDNSVLSIDGIADWASIFIFNKILDEQSVVRDPEVQATAKSSGAISQFLTYIKSVADGDKIDAKARRAILVVSRALQKQYEDDYKNHIISYADTIQNWKTNYDNLDKLSYISILGKNNMQLIDPEAAIYKWK
jgi:hypothetical protein